MQQPLVTVGVASYNNEPFLRETLESIRNQTYKNFELIIVDDASTDKSVALIEAWQAEFPEVNSRLIHHAQNAGICPTFNEIVRNANGEFICIIGSDDVYLPDKLAVHVALLQQAPPEVGVITSPIEFINAQGDIIPKPDDFAIAHSEDVYLTLLRSCIIAAMSVLVRRACYDKVGLYDESLPFEDWDMWLRIAREYRFLYSPKVSALYRRHGNSIFEKQKIAMQEGALRLLAKQRGYSPEADALIKAQTRLRAEQIYQLGGKTAAYWLRVRWQDDRSWSSYLLYRMAAAGLAGSTVVKWQRRLGR
jgi:glycosyltransferase involved in cell wall biosynthesis